MFDIAVVGAGLIGAALVNALAKTGLKIVWLDSNDLLTPPKALHTDPLLNLPRVSALTKPSENLLKNLGVWQQIVDKQPYLSMQVWDGQGTGELSFSSELVRQPNLGHIVQNDAVLAALLAPMAQYRNVTLMSYANIQSLQQGEIVLASGAVIQAKLILGCDGANSQVRDSMTMSYSELPYGHHALVANIRTSAPHQACCWQNFTSQGPVAFLPLHHKHHCSIVYSAPLDEIEILLALSDREFCQHLEIISESRLGNIQAVGQRLSFELKERKASRYVEAGFALLGDAAHTIHPLAGQGANLGFLDVAAMVQTIDYAMKRGLDIADESVLRRYQRARQSQNLAMAQGRQLNKGAFAVDNLAGRWLRNAGLHFLQQQSLLKKPMIKAAMGLIGPSYPLTR